MPSRTSRSQVASRLAFSVAARRGFGCGFASSCRSARTPVPSAASTTAPGTGIRQGFGSTARTCCSLSALVCAPASSTAMRRRISGSACASGVLGGLDGGASASASSASSRAGAALLPRAAADVRAQKPFGTSSPGLIEHGPRNGPRELKGSALLKRKVFRHQDFGVDVDRADISALAHAALDDGAHADRRMLKALAQAKVSYVGSVFDICREFRCRAFASIVETDAPPTEAGGLRKDYAYLFQRFFYFLQDMGDEQGIVVFDELEKSQSHLLIHQMRQYFGETAVGRNRARRIISEPFFVHSDLTTGIQIGDLAAYVISWGFRLPRMAKPARMELSGLADQIAGLRHLAIRNLNGNPNFHVWSFAHITDLRTLPERLND